MVVVSVWLINERSHSRDYNFNKNNTVVPHGVYSTLGHTEWEGHTVSWIQKPPPRSHATKHYVSRSRLQFKASLLTISSTRLTATTTQDAIICSNRNRQQRLVSQYRIIKKGLEYLVSLLALIYENSTKNSMIRSKRYFSKLLTS